MANYFLSICRSFIDVAVVFPYKRLNIVWYIPGNPRIDSPDHLCLRVRVFPDLAGY